MTAINQKPSQAYLADLIAQSSFAGQLRGGAPVLVARHEPPGVVFANGAAHSLFKTRDLEQLNAAVMDAMSPGARRLRQLAATVAADAAPRLELLRFYIGRLPLQVALLCAPVVDPRGQVFLVAALPAVAREPQSEEGVSPPASELSERAPSAPMQARTRGAQGIPARRFLWSMDRHFCFEASAEALVAAVADAAPRAAESLEALKTRTGLDESGEFARALARQATFGPLRLAWPRGSGDETGDEALVVLLSGAPLFDRERRFVGYRGFGVLTGETTRFEPKRQLEEREASPEASQDTTLAMIRAEMERDTNVATGSGARAPAPSEEQPPRSAPSAEPTSPDEAAPPIEGSASGSPIFPERSAEIVPLRAPGQPPYAGPNVVPIRPGALRPFPSSDEGARGGGEDESVELTLHERDAFREIARALGAKIRDHREGRTGSAPGAAEGSPPPGEGQTGEAELDASDPHAPTGGAGDEASADPAANAAAPIGDRAARNQSDLLDRLPIGALVLRGREPLYLNRTLLDLLDYRDLAQFRAKSGLMHVFDGRPLEQIALPHEGGPLTLISADGESIAFDGQKQEINWDGESATLISLRRAIEARVAAEMRALALDAQTRASEARELSAVLDTATDGVVVLDARGRILSLNRSGEALFGFDQNDVAGEDFLTLFSAESRESVKAYFDGLRTDGLASLLNDGREALGRERHGRTIPLFITLGRINSSPDAKFCAVLRDMTQWKTIERDLEEARGQAEKASALKSEFLAKISHEIRTPLNAILGFAEVIMDERFGPVDNDRYKAYLKDIHSSGSHVMSLINDLLDLSKIEAGKLDLDFVAVDANGIIQECVSLMQPQAAQERIIMRLSLFDKLPRIIADERSLRQIMLNLMSNAVKFNEPGGQVIVSTAMNDSGQAVIRVRDTGIGMSDAELGMALEPFRRISTTRPTGGTGLGLPLTKALVEANRAGFSIKSRKEQGTLVEVAFPTAQAAAAQ